MHKVILLVSMFLLICCGPSEDDCQQLCDWASQVCTDSPESCMEDCLDASSSDVDYAMGQCLDSSPSSCKSANCCLRFTYTDYYWQQNC